MELHSGREFNVVFEDRIIVTSGRGRGGGDRDGSLVFFIDTK